MTWFSVLHQESVCGHTLCFHHVEMISNNMIFKQKKHCAVQNLSSNPGDSPLHSIQARTFPGQSPGRVVRTPATSSTDGSARKGKDLAQPSRDTEQPRSYPPSGPTG